VRFLSIGRTMSDIFEQYEYFRSKGPYFEDRDSVPAAPPVESPVRYIAYYLPQFHAIPENDLWWGAGFTEWSNVTRALPRYAGHYQPRSPADLGFYDLTNVDTIRAQAQLARRAGVHGFCIHDYWFSGTKLLETPLNLLLQNPDIDLPFCLNWANESWSRRWDGSEHKVLMHQRYLPGDDVAYAASILPALQDPRYISIDGRPLLMIYRPSVIPDARKFIDNIRNFLVREGYQNPYLVMAQTFNNFDPREFGLDAAAGFPPHGMVGHGIYNERGRQKLLDPRFNGTVISYDRMAKRLLANTGDGYTLFPCVCPNWDNEARKGREGTSYYGSTPGKYGNWLRAASDAAMAASSGESRIVFINAWNEWAEGAYLEPDRHHGFAYLAETRRVLDALAQETPPSGEIGRDRARSKFQARPSLLNHLPNFANFVRGKFLRLRRRIADRMER
jgi:lipopolysaccharide biosynthesis protein